MDRQIVLGLFGISGKMPRLLVGVAVGVDRVLHCATLDCASGVVSRLFSYGDGVSGGFRVAG